MTSQNLTSLERDYFLLRTSAGISVHGADYLSLRGAESLDFLNRLSTNDLRNLPPSRVRPTILTTEKGRMIDLAMVVRMEGLVLLLVSEGNGEPVKAWLEKYIIMEDITVTNVTPDYKRISIIGPEALSTMRGFLGADLSIPGDTVVPVAGGSDLFIYRNPEWPLEAYDLVGGAAQIGNAVDRMGDIAADEVSRARELLRVEMGVPEGGKEIDERVNPLEAGLVRFVSFTKGCYIGQEVIARLDTYKKVQRKLTGFLFPEGYQNDSPGSLFADEVEVGWTTTHAHSHQLGKQIALGYLKSDPEYKSVTFVQEETHQEVPVEVVQLPFVLPEPEHSPSA
jgi:folate-binding protein YgfZ